MRRFLIVAVLVMLSASVAQRSLSQSCSVDFCDDFGTTPYSAELPSLRRWCERFHHVHWDAVNHFLEVPRAGNQTTADCSFEGPNVSLSCEGEPPGCVCSASGSACSSTSGGGAAFAITKGTYPGYTRSAEVSFGLRNHPDPLKAAHVPVFSETHRNCHTGVQAVPEIVNRATGTYRLAIQIQNDPLAGFAECGGFFERHYALIDPAGDPDDPANFQTTTLALVGPSDPPNYRIVTTSRRDASMSIVARARVFAISNPSTPLLDTGDFTFGTTGSGWYNVAGRGQKFGIGGGPMSQPPASFEINWLMFDDFRGDGC